MTRKNLFAVCGAFPGPIGGTTILVKQQFDELQRDGEYRVEKVDYTEAKPFLGSQALGVVVRTVRAIARADAVCVNVSKRGFEALMVPVALAQALKGTVVLVRYFGGDADEVFSRLPAALTRLLYAVARGRVTILTETVQNIAHFEGHGLAVYQLTNSRPAVQVAATAGRADGQPFRLVFMAQMKAAKGVTDVIAAVQGLPDVEVDFYGPLLWDISAAQFDGLPNVAYRGTVPLGEAQQVMAGYDAMIFPTTYEGESHAGVVIEAYSVGLPVLAYAWRAIPEIVRHGSTGLLAPCGDVSALRANMVELARNRARWQQMSSQCLQFFNRCFTAEASVQRLKQILAHLVLRKPAEAAPSKWQLPQ